jgi:hypothetical protein
MSRGRHLTTADLYRLDIACAPLRRLINSPGGIYLVGSIEKGERDWRDVDVRLILPDEEFDALFGGKPDLWALFSYAVSRQLADDTDLPIDFQVQRMTEANNHTGPRNPLGRGARIFAGWGDATPFWDEIVAEHGARDAAPSSADA